MLLTERLQRDGEALFRRRSYLPLLLLPLAILATSEAGYFNQVFGHFWEEVWMAGCGALCLVGVLVRWLTVGHVPPGTSGRVTKRLKADDLNTSGMYSVVRNPLYLGNYLVFLGAALATRTWWFPVLATLAFVIYYERIILAEERYLLERYGARYVSWARNTPAFIPNPRRWQSAKRGFSFRMALRREYGSTFGTIAMLTAVELGTDLLGEGMTLRTWLHDDYVWWLVFCVGLTLFLALRAVKKHTTWLQIDPQGMAGARG